MKKVFLMFALALSVAASSCTKDPVFGDDPKGGCDGRDPKPSSCEALKVDTSGGDNIIDCINDEKIKRAWIEGDNLKIDVAYSGCNKHDFDLNWNGSFMKSNPPQATVELTDNTGEQMCEAYFQHTLCFNISKLRDGGNGSVKVHLAGYMQDLEYKY
ncbi:MAG: hypothetical protein ACXWDO_11985 [Bacteroidia bacterium]